MPLDQKLPVGGVSSATVNTNSNQPIEMNINRSYGKDTPDVNSTSPNLRLHVKCLLSDIIHNDMSIRTDCPPDGVGNGDPPTPVYPLPAQPRNLHVLLILATATEIEIEWDLWDLG